MQNVSLEHTTVLINGHRCRGWANTGDALQFPDIEMAQTERGADGQMVASSTGNRGGEIMLKFMSNSPSFLFFMQKKVEIDRGASIEFNGTVRNAQTGMTSRLERGVLKRAPAGQNVGNAPGPDGVNSLSTLSRSLRDPTGARVQEPPTA